jgi:hypothetical protein
MSVVAKEEDGFLAALGMTDDLRRHLATSSELDYHRTAPAVKRTEAEPSEPIS